MAARPGMVLVYFYRESSQVGCALLMHIDELVQDGRPVSSDNQSASPQEQEIGILNNGSYLGVYLWPGKHTLYGTAWRHDETSYLDAELETGKIYYFSGMFYHPVPSGQPGAVVFIAVDPAKALHEMAELPKADTDLGTLGDCL
ncbi:MAG TPA: hypothetical protein VGH91_13410 [Gammaproteobacteria bacterium]